MANTLNPIHEVKLRWLRKLATLMPPITDDPAGRRVPVFYSYPGDDYAGREFLFASGARTSSQVHSMRAEKRKRVLTCEFELVTEVLIEGRSQLVDITDPGSPLPYAADLRAEALWAIAENHIATEEHLACPDIVDKAWAGDVVNQDGVQDTGSWTRCIATIRFEARIL